MTRRQASRECAFSLVGRRGGGKGGQERRGCVVRRAACGAWLHKVQDRAGLNARMYVDGRMPCTPDRPYPPPPRPWPLDYLASHAMAMAMPASDRHPPSPSVPARPACPPHAFTRSATGERRDLGLPSAACCCCRSCTCACACSCCSSSSPLSVPPPCRDSALIHRVE